MQCNVVYIIPYYIAIGHSKFDNAEDNTVHSGYSGHGYSGHSDIVASFPGTKYIYSIIFRSDIVSNRI